MFLQSDPRLETASLELTSDERRRAATLVVEHILRLFDTLREQPGFATASSLDMQSLSEPLPNQPHAFEDVLRRLEREVLPFVARPQHPRFLAFVPSPSNFIGVLADCLVSAHNIFAGCWFEGAGASMIESVTVNWLRELAGYPESGFGLFVSGGSMANLTALAAAREACPGGLVYYSDQTHSSVERALRLLGFESRQFRKLPSDSEFRLRLDALREAGAADRTRICCVVANGGTTNTGAVDPLPEIAAFCREHKAWMHVDAAFGGPALLTPGGRDMLAGIDLSDSLTLDPHKWLFQPFDCGCVLVRDRERLSSIFQMTPEYLKDTLSTGETNFWDYGPELTRPFRALKLWLSLQVFGAEAFTAAIEHGFELARTAAGLIAEMPSWRIVTGPQLAVVTFRYEPEGVPEELRNEWNRRIGQQLTRSGLGVVLTTELRGSTVLRLCTINPRTTADDLRAIATALDSLAKEIAPQA